MGHVSFSENRPSLVKDVQFHLVEAKADNANSMSNTDAYVTIKIQDGQTSLATLRSGKVRSKTGPTWHENVGNINLLPSCTLVFQLRTQSVFGRPKVIAASESVTFEQLIEMQGRLDDRSLRLTLPLYHMSEPLPWGCLILNLRRIIRDTPHEAKEQAKEIQERRRSLGTIPPIIITRDSGESSSSPGSSQEGLPLTPVTPAPISDLNTNLKGDNLITVEDRIPRLGDTKVRAVVYTP